MTSIRYSKLWASGAELSLIAFNPTSSTVKTLRFVKSDNILDGEGGAIILVPLAYQKLDTLKVTSQTLRRPFHTNTHTIPAIFRVCCSHCFGGRLSWS